MLRRCLGVVLYAGDLKNIFVGEKLFSLSYSSAILKVRQTTFKSHVYLCVLTEVSVFFFCFLFFFCFSSCSFNVLKENSLNGKS